MDPNPVGSLGESPLQAWLQEHEFRLPNRPRIIFGKRLCYHDTVKFEVLKHGVYLFEANRMGL